ncbi:hypothetical protein DBV10_15005 [Acidovorax sp. FJL06]|nr:hypothetical protein DBV10_15005 [Acidovorax sp. FJL06]
MMVLTLHIRHEGSHQYLARVFDGKVQVGGATLHGRIDEAIAAYGAQGSQSFPGVTAFTVWYGGWSIGAKPLAQMVDEATFLANRLVVLSAVAR